MAFPRAFYTIGRSGARSLLRVRRRRRRGRDAPIPPPRPLGFDRSLLCVVGWLFAQNTMVNSPKTSPSATRAQAHSVRALAAGASTIIDTLAKRNPEVRCRHAGAAPTTWGGKEE